MNLFDIISEIEQGYINQRPNLKEMQALVAGMGWTAEYEHSFCLRWCQWVCYYDCKYALTRNHNDMRNYTA
jgi:hypothetical protein